MSSVAIVGGGIAGLSCARSLHRAGIPFILLEATDRIGGRLKTDQVDGFLLDHGFQVYFTSYPTASRLLDYPQLDLRRFDPGAQVFRDGNLHLIDRTNPAAMALSPFLGMRDKLRLLSLTTEARGMTTSQIWRLPDLPAQRLLRRRGFSEDFLEKFARPFFGGIFLDNGLQVSSRMFLFVLKMLSEGDTVVPAAGIEAIPRQIAASIPVAWMRLNTRVESVLEHNGKVSGVKTSSGETLPCEAVVIATEADQAAKLSGFPTVEGARHSTCLYFEADEPPIDDKLIILNGSGRGVVNEVVPVSNVAPSYAPRGRHLVSATILGYDDTPDDLLAADVKRELKSWFPDNAVGDWHFLHAYRSRYAQMPQPPGFREHLPSNCPGVNGLYFAGEFTVNSSIDGAIESGLACGRLLREDLVKG